MSSISIVITSINGRHLLERHLPKVLKNSPPGSKIFVFDDAGTDDTPKFLQDKYPAIEFTRNPKNLGFTKNTNLAIKKADSEFVVLLNNDVSPKKDYLKNALRHFKDSQIFAVTFAEDAHSWPYVTWVDGKLSYFDAKEREHPHLVAWASGGSCIIRKAIWDKLGGFNEIYSPGYWEDIDIGWRAYKQGFKIIWEPNAKVDHQHETTFKTLKPSFVSNLKQRNELLFTWQNITDRDLALSHFKFLITYTASHGGYLKIILRALLFYPRLIKNRVRNRKTAILTDHQVLDLINQPL